jgi:hypothetical protein
MTARPRRPTSTGVIALGVWLVAGIAGAEPDRFSGRTLTEALELLRGRGLPIVYSTAVVTAGMRVTREPTAGEARDILDQLLQPHALQARRGPGGVLQIVRTPRPDRGPKPPLREPPSPAPAGASAPDRSPESAWRHVETVVVTAPPAVLTHRDVAAETTWTAAQVQARSTGLTGDPLGALQSAPRLSGASDFRSDFSLRGTAPRHVGLVIEGVPASTLRHAVYGAGESPMLTMVSSTVVDHLTLQAGAYPRRYGDALGGQVVLGIREGSRAETKVGGSIGGVAAVLTAEGPLGRSSRGSWLVSGRQSFLDWPTTSFTSEYGGLGFGFRDLQAKAVFDVSGSQQLSASAVTGHSLADLNDRVGADGLFEGRHRASLVALGWRSTPTNALVLQQRAHVLTHDLRNTDPGGVTLLAGGERSIGYRADLLRVWPGVSLEAGGQLSRVDATRGGARLDERSARLLERAAFAHMAWTPSPSLTLSPGLRLSQSDLSQGASLSRWMHAEWKLASLLTFAADGGVGHQLPDAAMALESRQRLPVERARYIDVTVERDIGRGARVQATWFDRSERNVLDQERGTHSLAGRSRGAELAFTLSAPRRATGSIGYSFGRTRHTDTDSGERFRGDFDQRHALTAFTSYEWLRTTVAVSFRSASGLPVAGRFEWRDGSMFPGVRRNEVRRPAYARLDVRASRPLTIGGRKLGVFVEILNVLNRPNLGPANGAILPSGEAAGFSETLLPRFVGAGLRFDFD